jgi:hypothetical protein
MSFFCGAGTPARRAGNHAGACAAIMEHTKRRQECPRHMGHSNLHRAGRVAR